MDERELSVSLDHEVLEAATVAVTMIELDEQTAEMLRAQAHVRNLTLGTFLQDLAASTLPVNSSQPVAAKDFDGLINSVAGNDPVLPSSISRSDIYREHD